MKLALKSVPARIFSTSHTTIARQYFLLSLLAVVTGVFLSLLMRYHLVYPQTPVHWFQYLWPIKAQGGIMTPELYLSLMTLHGTLMVFFVLTLAPLNAFGNLVIPKHLNTPAMAFPRLNALSFWITALSFLTLLLSIVVQDGGPLSGWTAYPPLSAVGSIAGPGQGAGQTLWFISIGIFCLASTLTAINFIATILDTATPLFQLPLTIWNWLITSFLTLISFPVLLAAALLILLDRHAGTSFFIPANLQFADTAINHAGGSPILWQHLFWFFGHPEVYIAILPAMGIVSHLLAHYSGKPVFAYKAMVWSTIAIAGLGLAVWGHHMFISGLSPYSVLAFSVLTMAIGIPSSVKVFNWIATLWGGVALHRTRYTTAMLFCLGFISIFVTGGLSGIFLAQPQIDAYFHDTYFVVAHFHLIMGIASLFGIFAATFHWFPLLFGRAMNETLGRIHFGLTFVLAYATFGPMHFAGIAGAPRRYADFTTFDFLAPLMPLQRWITWCAFALAASQLIFLVNLFWSMARGPLADAEGGY